MSGQSVFRLLRGRPTSDDTWSRSRPGTAFDTSGNTIATSDFLRLRIFFQQIPLSLSMIGDALTACITCSNMFPHFPRHVATLQLRSFWRPLAFILLPQIVTQDANYRPWSANLILSCGCSLVPQWWSDIAKLQRMGPSHFVDPTLCPVYPAWCAHNVWCCAMTLATLVLLNLVPSSPVQPDLLLRHRSSVRAPSRGQTKRTMLLCKLAHACTVSRARKSRFCLVCVIRSKSLFSVGSSC